MPKTKTSPARSQGGATSPKRKIPRGSRSLCSPALSTASGRLTSLIDQFKDKNMESFALSPLTGRSVLNDNTEIEEPRRKSWWKNLDENSQDVMEVLEDNILTVNNAIEELIDIDVLSQEKKNYTLDLPESSDNESINSIVLPQRRLFTQKENQPQKKYGHLIDNRESLAKLHKTNTTNIDKTINVGTRELFQNAKRSKPIFPASLLNLSSNKTAADKTRENALADPKPQVRNIFGNRPANKRKNMFADFIVSESEDEIPEIQPKVFEFQKKLEQRRISSISKGRDASPALSITTDIEMDFRMLLPSSTMVENQLEDNIMSEENTPIKRARLSKLSEVKESEAGTLQSMTTSDRTKQSNEPVASKNKSHASPELKDKSLNSSRTTRSMLKNASKRGEQTNTTPDKTKQSNNSVASKNKSKASPELKDKSLNNSRTTANDEEMNESQEEAAKESQEVENEVSQGEDEEEANESDENVDDTIVSAVNKDEANESQEVETKVIERQENEEEASKSQEVEAEVNYSQKVEQETNESQEIEEEANEIQEVLDAHSSDEENYEGMDEDEEETTKENQVHENESQEVENGNEESHEVVNKSQKVEVETNESQEVEEKANKRQEIVDAHSSDKEDDEQMCEHEEDTGNEVQVHENESKEVENDKEEFHEVVNESQKVNEETSKEIEEMANESQQIEEEANESQQIESEANKSEENEEEANESQEIEEEANESLEIETEAIGRQEKDEESNESQEIDDEAHESQEVVDGHASDEENDEGMNEAEEESDNESQVHENESQEVENDGEESHELTSEAESEEVEDDQQMDDSDEADKAIASDPEISDDNQADEIEVDDDENEQESDDETKQNEHESHEERQIEEQNEIVQSEEIEESPNVTHDTTGRHRKKDLNKSLEMILHDKTNQNDSFTAKGRNTSVRKTKSMIKNLNIRPSLAPSRDSAGFSDGTRNSSAEGSGWDSHRTTRKTLRATFGKDFTPRKSLRALVMEQSAKRQKEHLEMHSETVKFPLANSTEMPEDSNHHVEDIVESDHEMSRQTRQTTLEMYLQKMKEQNIEKRLKMEAAVRNSLKNPITNSLSLFKVPKKPAPRRPKPTQSKAKKPLKSIICIDDLPAEMIEDMKYKPPKRYQPPNASWITKRLYKYLENKLEAKYDYKARVRAEKLVETIYLFVKDLRRHDVAPPDAVNVLKHELARLEVVRTHFEFNEFIHEFMPREVRIKVVPDIVNKISPPRHGPFSDILRNGNTVNE